MSELIERLEDCARRIDIDGTPSQIVSAEELREIAVGLQEALAAAETERDQAKRLFETNIDRAENQWKAWEARATAAEALLAETRKKALEEAAAIENLPPRTLGEAMLESSHHAVERYRAAIRALAEEVRT